MAQVPRVPYESTRALCGPCLHEARSVAQADLYTLDWDGTPAVLKDFSARPWLVRVLWSRRVAARETLMLARMKGLEGTPQLLAIAGPNAFVMTRLDATRLPGKRQPPPPPEFWHRARAVLEELHGRGVAHGDLRRKNLLIGPAGEAYLIDFATAIYRPVGESGGLSGWFFRRLRRIDRVTFARMKASYKNAPLSSQEAAWLNEEPVYLKLGRFLKKNVYRLRKGKTWRKYWHKSTRAIRHWLRGTPPPKPPKSR